MTYEISTVHLDEQPVAVVSARVDVAGIGEWIGRAIGDVMAAVAAAGGAIAGPPFARYHLVSPGHFDVTAGFPLAAPLPQAAAGTGSRVKASTLPGGEAATVWHIGPYDAMVPAYEAIGAWLGEKHLDADGDAWEVYFSEPTTPPATWRTQIVQP
ncbi:MAG TPA: GyrI-like domain-containing protein, partial [Acidimicrobiales bacterium]|nr:GyrI-like domain-containing protein [Acidimicrobiales bacterium]